MGILGTAKLGVIGIGILAAYLIFQKSGGAAGIGQKIGSAFGGGLNAFGTKIQESFTNSLFGGLGGGSSGGGGIFDILPTATAEEDDKPKTGPFVEECKKGNCGGFPNSRLIDTQSRTLTFQGSAQDGINRGFISDVVRRSAENAGVFIGGSKEVQVFEHRKVGPNVTSLTIGSSGRMRNVSEGTAQRLLARGFVLG